MLGNIIGAIGSVAGGLLGSKASEDNAKRNIRLQKEFAQSGIQWKVADAKAAGIHPLYALGATTHSFSPQSVGDPLGASIAQAGQEIGRGVTASQDKSERANSILSTLSIERAQLENQLLASQIRKMNQPATGPGVGDRWLIDGQGETALPRMLTQVPGTTVQEIKEKPMDRTISDLGRPYQEPGALPDVGFSRTHSGWAPVTSKDVKERIEDMWIQEMAWSLRNQLAPMLGQSHWKPPFDAPNGKKWIWNPLKFEYQLWDKRTR